MHAWKKRGMRIGFLRKSQKEIPLGRPRREDNIKIDLKDTGWGSMNWIDLAQNRDQWMALVNTVKKIRVR
jgi:hypothetical protein